MEITQEIRDAYALLKDRGFYIGLPDEYIELYKPKPKSYIYFIGDGNFVKIGLTSDVKTRKIDLQIGNPHQ